MIGELRNSCKSSKQSTEILYLKKNKKILYTAKCSEQQHTHHHF